MGCHWSRQEDAVVHASQGKLAEDGKPQLSAANKTKSKPKTSKHAKRRRKQQVAGEPKTSSFSMTLRRKRNHKSKSNISTLYPRLPPGARKCTCLRVYDGDTLTLNNRSKQRVRLLGIDTPELHPKQAFSDEAKAFTVAKCLEQVKTKNVIWISFEKDSPPGGATDKYGRLLAWVWVQLANGKYECVNESLLKLGYATVYTPSKETKLSNMDKLVALQKEARSAKRGLWRHWRDFSAVKTKYGCAYHHRNQKCEHLKRSTHLTPIQATAALDEGLHPCRTCLAEEETTKDDESSVQFWQGKRSEGIRQ